jgi:hypothetical protein
MSRRAAMMASVAFGAFVFSISVQGSAFGQLAEQGRSLGLGIYSATRGIAIPIETFTAELRSGFDRLGYNLGSRQQNADALARNLNAELLSWQKERVGTGIAQAGFVAIGATLGGVTAGVGTAGTFSGQGAAFGAMIGNQAFEMVLGQTVRDTNRAFNSAVNTIVIAEIGRVGQNDPELTAAMELKRFDLAAARLARLSGAALSHRAVGAMDENARNGLIMEVLTQGLGNLIQVSAQQQQGEIVRAREVAERVGQELNAFRTTVDQRFGRIESAVQRHGEHITRLQESVSDLATQTNANTEDIAFLMDATIGRMSPEEQQRLFADGRPHHWGPEQRKAAEESARRLSRVNAAREGLQIAADSVALARNLAQITGADAATTRSIEVLGENVQTAQQVLAIGAAFLVPGGGLLAALPAINGLLGGAGGPAGVNPALAAQLAAIDERLKRVEQKIEEVLSLQRETLQRLSSLSVQLADVEANILGAIRRVDDKIDFITSVISWNPAAQRENCNRITYSEVPGSSVRQLVVRKSLDEFRRAYDTLRTRVNGCLAIIDVEIGPISNNANLLSPFLRISPSDIGVSPAILNEQAVRTAMYDLSLALRATPAAGNVLDSVDCQRRLMSQLVMGPRVFGGVIDRPDLCASPAEGEVQPARWRSGGRAAIFPIWAALDEPVVGARVVELGDYVVAAGLWRAMTVRVSENVVRVLTDEEAQAGSVNGARIATAWDTDEHLKVMEEFHDILDIAVAQEAALAGVGMLNWARGALFGSPAAELMPSSSPLPLGEAQAQGQEARRLLQQMSDHPTLYEALRTWRNQGDQVRRRNVTVVDVARVMFSDPYEGDDQSVRRAHLAVPDVREALTKIASDAGFTVANSGVQVAVGLAYLRNVAWMIDANVVSPADSPQAWYDVACRLRTVEEPRWGLNRRNHNQMRGRQDGSRIEWLRALRPAVYGSTAANEAPDPTFPNLAYHLASCLAERNPVLRENILRSAVLARLHASSWSDPFAAYARALDDADGSELYLDILRGWPLARVDGRWSLVVRSPEGRRLYWPLPRPEAFRGGQIAYGPAMDGLLTQRDRLAEQRLLFEPVPDALRNDPDGLAFVRSALVRAHVQAGAR